MVNNKEGLLKIAYAIKEKCGESSCPCKKDCDVYSDEACIERIIEWLESVLDGCEIKKDITIKDYASMPEVLIDRKVFVDREVFRGYALHLLQQELDAAMSSGEEIGLEVAMSVIGGIR